MDFGKRKSDSEGELCRNRGRDIIVVSRDKYLNHAGYVEKNVALPNFKLY